MSQDAEALRAEVDHWRNIALWLAECHAATAEYEGSLKRTSESSRRRFRRICELAEKMIRTQCFTERTAHPSAVLERLSEAARERAGGK